jgi:hypothetical protein
MADDKPLFMNRRTGAKSAILRSYKGESEDDAIMRLEANGWQIRGQEFWRDEDGVFHAGSKGDFFEDKREEKEDGK